MRCVDIIDWVGLRERDVMINELMSIEPMAAMMVADRLNSDMMLWVYMVHVLYMMHKLVVMDWMMRADTIRGQVIKSATVVISADVGAFWEAHLVANIVLELHRIMIHCFFFELRFPSKSRMRRNHCSRLVVLRLRMYLRIKRIVVA